MRKIEISSTHVRLSTHVMWRIGSFTRVTWHFWSFWSHMWRDKFDHLQVWDDKFNHLHVWRDTFDFICTCHVWSFTRVTWHIHTLDEPYLYLLHASFLCDIFTPRLRAKLICATYQTWVGTRLNSVCHDSLFICFMPRFWSASCLVSFCASRLIYMRGMTHAHVWHDSFIRVTWLFHVCHTTHPCAWHD